MAVNAGESPSFNHQSINNQKSLSVDETLPVDLNLINITRSDQNQDQKSSVEKSSSSDHSFQIFNPGSSLSEIPNEPDVDIFSQSINSIQKTRTGTTLGTVFETCTSKSKKSDSGSLSTSELCRSAITYTSTSVFEEQDCALEGKKLGERTEKNLLSDETQKKDKVYTDIYQKNKPTCKNANEVQPNPHYKSSEQVKVQAGSSQNKKNKRHSYPASFEKKDNHQQLSNANGLLADVELQLDSLKRKLEKRETGSSCLPVNLKPSLSKGSEICITNITKVTSGSISEQSGVDISSPKSLLRTNYPSCNKNQPAGTESIFKNIDEQQEQHELFLKRLESELNTTLFESSISNEDSLYKRIETFNLNEHKEKSPPDSFDSSTAPFSPTQQDTAEKIHQHQKSEADSSYQSRFFDNTSCVTPSYLEALENDNEFVGSPTPTCSPSFQNTSVIGTGSSLKSDVTKEFDSGTLQLPAITIPSPPSASYISSKKSSESDFIDLVKSPDLFQVPTPKYQRIYAPVNKVSACPYHKSNTNLSVEELREDCLSIIEQKNDSDSEDSKANTSNRQSGKDSPKKLKARPISLVFSEATVGTFNTNTSLQTYATHSQQTKENILKTHHQTLERAACNSPQETSDIKSLSQDTTNSINLRRKNLLKSIQSARQSICTSSIAQTGALIKEGKKLSKSTRTFSNNSVTNSWVWDSNRDTVKKKSQSIGKKFVKGIKHPTSCRQIPDTNDRATPTQTFQASSTRASSFIADSYLFALDRTFSAGPGQSEILAQQAGQIERKGRTVSTGVDIEADPNFLKFLLEGGDLEKEEALFGCGFDKKLRLTKAGKLGKGKLGVWGGSDFSLVICIY